MRSFVQILVWVPSDFVMRKIVYVCALFCYILLFLMSDIFKNKSVNFNILPPTINVMKKVRMHPRASQFGTISGSIGTKDWKSHASQFFYMRSFWTPTQWQLCDGSFVSLSHFSIYIYDGFADWIYTYPRIGRKCACGLAQVFHFILLSEWETRVYFTSQQIPSTLLRSHNAVFLCFDHCFTKPT